MAFSYLRHQFGLYRYQVIVILFLTISTCLPAIAQRKYVQQNLPGHDLKPMHYGLFLAINASRFQLEHSKYFVDRQRDTLRVNPKFGPGFALGFVINKRITDYIDLRFVPGGSFYSRTVEYKVNNKEVSHELSAIAIDFPLLFKFKSDRRGNSRMYFVGGAKAGIDFGNKKKGNTSTELEANNVDLALEYGVGLELFYPYFKFAPEIRFSNGLINRYASGVNPYSRSTQGLKSNTITLYINFEN
jgi:hypothetical protein